METINLLPWRSIKKQREIVYGITVLSITLFLTLCLLLSVHYYLASKLQPLTQNSKILSYAIKKNNVALKNYLKILATLQSTLAIQSSLQKKLASLYTLEHSFRLIIKTTPTAIQLTTLTKYKNKFILQGLFAHYSSLQQFKSNLARNRFFKKITFSEISPINKQSQRFTLALKRKYTRHYHTP